MIEKHGKREDYVRWDLVRGDDYLFLACARCVDVLFEMRGELKKTVRGLRITKLVLMVIWVVSWILFGVFGAFGFSFVDFGILVVLWIFSGLFWTFGFLVLWSFYEGRVRGEVLLWSECRQKLLLPHKDSVVDLDTFGPGGLCDVYVDRLKSDKNLSCYRSVFSVILRWRKASETFRSLLGTRDPEFQTVVLEKCVPVLVITKNKIKDSLASVYVMRTQSDVEEVAKQARLVVRELEVINEMLNQLESVMYYL